MKIKSLILAVLFAALGTSAKAQHVRVQLSFPVGAHMMAPGPAPYREAIWIGPEWEWRGGQYVCVRGIGPDRGVLAKYGCPVIGNIPAEDIYGYADTGGK